MRYHFLLLSCFLSAFFPFPAAAQIRDVLAIPTFSYGGEVWTDNLGAAMTDALIARLRMDGQYVMMSREDVSAKLKEYGIDEAYDAPLSRAATAYRAIRPNYVIAGRITGIAQTVDVDSTVLVTLTVDIQIIDPYSPFIITSERVEASAKLEQELTGETAWDKGLASKLISPAAGRLRHRIVSVLERQQF